MGRLRERDDPDRYIAWIDGNAQYKRHVPLNVAHADKRAPVIRKSMKTRDLAVARKKRDMLEAADDALWASIVSDQPIDPARQRFEAAVRRVEALGFAFHPARALEQVDHLDDLRRRVFEAREHEGTRDPELDLLGAVRVPKTSISQAFRIYVDEIVASELIGKSKAQRDQWEKVKLRAVNNFIAITGTDKAMEEITVDDAKKVYLHWLGRIAPKSGKATATASSGNRDIGNLRVLYAAFFRHNGQTNRANPFDGFGYSQKLKRSRPPIPTEWIRDTIMAPGALAGLNDEARAILLIMIETGARPSEIANLNATTIRLSHKVPHLAIEPREDPNDPREIKTASSRRLVPLLGVALAAAERHRGGFPRYKDRENDLSAALNKFLRTNGLLPSPGHKVYSIRHSFEDRMKEGNVDEELRRILVGHTIDRPKYGSGGSLEWRRDQLRPIVLKFDSSIV